MQAKWYHDAETVEPKWFLDNVDDYWKGIAVIREFEKGNNKDKELKDLVLRICHQFLMVHFFARMDGTRNIIVPEFFVLYCMKRVRRINLVFVHSNNSRIVSARTKSSHHSAQSSLS